MLSCVHVQEWGREGHLASSLYEKTNQSESVGPITEAHVRPPHTRVIAERRRSGEQLWRTLK